MLLRTQTKHQQPTLCVSERTGMESTKCRQNSNLLITYLLFTFVREECGAGWQRLPSVLWKEAFSVEGATRFLSSWQIKTAFHRVFPEEARGAKPPTLSTWLLTLVHRSGFLTLTFRDPDNTCWAILTKACVHYHLKTAQGLVDSFLRYNLKTKTSGMLQSWEKWWISLKVNAKLNPLSTKVRQITKVTLICERVGANKACRLYSHVKRLSNILHMYMFLHNS